MNYYPNIFKTFEFTLNGLTYQGYGFMMTTIFLIDTLYFTFGYLFESEFLKNKVRSVEPTAFGWFVALVCYPPFNDLFGKFVPWAANDYMEFTSNLTATFIARLLVILLLLIYLWATLSLGTKCSNLTNRGIIKKGAYKYVRHPAYISKNLAWWIMLIPTISIAGIFGMLIWSLIYFFRAITEERHLIQDPDYVQYCKQTKYRFIPGVY
jgi:protein-S-isoprenylcysteine O-methyltransferase Ste14